jgi:hypothetical protein
MWCEGRWPDTLASVGWTARLEDEHGATVAELSSTDDAALGRAQGSPEEYPRIAEIDPYGDTVFNKLQIPALLRELDVLVDETDRSQSSNGCWTYALPPSGSLGERTYISGFSATDRQALTGRSASHIPTSIGRSRRAGRAAHGSNR